MAEAPIPRLGLDLEDRVQVGQPMDSPGGVGGIIIARSPWWGADADGFGPDDQITLLSVHPERNSTTYLVADYTAAHGRLVRDASTVQRFLNIVPAAVYYQQAGGAWSGDCGHGRQPRPGCIGCDPDLADLAERIG